VQTVVVEPLNELVVDVMFSPHVDAAMTRCLDFTFSDCNSGTSKTARQEVTFDSQGLATGVSVPVSCGDYTCLRVEDSLHTLGRTNELSVEANVYTAEFVGDPAEGGQWLVMGDLYNDSYIDIFDFGEFVVAYGTNYGTGDTTCQTHAPHADLTGNGLVDSAEVTFILVNFLAEEDQPCCAGLRDQAVDGGPVREVSTARLRELSLDHLLRADLNNDGVVNEVDITVLLEGGLPRSAEPMKGNIRVRHLAD